MFGVFGFGWIFWVLLLGGCVVFCAAGAGDVCVGFWVPVRCDFLVALGFEWVWRCGGLYWSLGLAGLRFWLVCLGGYCGRVCCLPVAFGLVRAGVIYHLGGFLWFGMVDVLASTAVWGIWFVFVFCGCPELVGAFADFWWVDMLGFWWFGC